MPGGSISEHTETTRGGCHVTAEAEIGVMQLQATDRWPPQKLGRGKERLSPKVPEGAWPYRHLDFRLLDSRTVPQ